MPSSFPFQPNAHANAAGDETPDWASSDFPVFERAVNGGASARLQMVAQHNENGANKASSNPKAPPWLENWNRLVIEKKLASPEDVGEFNGLVRSYMLSHPRDMWAVQDIAKNKFGTITRGQDAAARRMFESDAFRAHRLGPKSRSTYTDAIASGELRVVP